VINVTASNLGVMNVHELKREIDLSIARRDIPLMVVITTGQFQFTGK